MPLIAATRAGLYTLDGGDPAVFMPGADFMALARAPAASGTCYAARREGEVFVTRDAGRTWERAGAIDGFEELSSLAIDPLHSERLLAGMEPGALFRSEDGGRTWTEDTAVRALAGDNDWSVPWSDAKGHVRTIAVDPGDPDRVYLAIEVGGVVRTADGGATWENIHGDIHDDVHSVAVDPRDGATVYAATRHGFGRSVDHGRTWARIDGFAGQGYARPLAVDPRQPGRLFTAAAPVGPGGFQRPVGSECGIYRSDDGGMTWSHLVNGLPARFKPYVDGLDVDPEIPDVVAIADGEGQLYRSRDGGESWASWTTLPPVRRLLFTA